MHKIFRHIALILWAVSMAPSADAQNTFKTDRIGAGPLPVPEGCAPSELLQSLAVNILKNHPLLMPKGRPRPRVDFLVCESDRFGIARANIRRWPDRTVEATVYVRSDYVEGDPLRLAVVVAHELAHVGVEVAGEKSQAGADGHGYAFLRRLVRAGLPAVAYEIIGPGGAMPHYSDAYRRASLEVCGRSSCGPEYVEDSALAAMKVE